MALTLLAGCAPTYQSLYEGDVRFEHCYRIDEERQSPVTEKLQCWRDWGRHYRYGQSRDRIGYALARERSLAQALAGGEPAPPHGAIGFANRTLPQPTNAYAPPPQTMTPGSKTAEASADIAHPAREAAAIDGGTTSERYSLNATSAETNATLIDAPGADCSGSCGKTWIACKQSCKQAPCQSGCDEHYRSCMKACY